MPKMVVLKKHLSLYLINIALFTVLSKIYKSRLIFTSTNP